MRLKQIKLAGFKSFVDLTKIPFEHALSAVVGPNGCGKSNVIDAVRWVLGESSAKHLRGDAMTDVIFNGSSARRPISVASVELTFDNTEGRLTGQYAGYQTIAVKRQVNRDAESSYFLNGKKCRRKDITDLFMGTGLGPRSYAIIEQGTISRLIESKPQELRVFIEEAAGISRYKERRRETENRIRHTRENLERLNDIRVELAGQIDKLQQQAQDARQYRQLKDQQRTCQSQLHVLRLQDLQSQADKLSTQVNAQQQLLESVSDQHRQGDNVVTQVKLQLTELTQSEHTLVEQYYACGSECSRIEQQLAHQQQQDSALAHKLTSITQKIQVVEESQQQLTVQLDEMISQLAQIEPQLNQINDEIEIADQQVHLLDEQSESLLQEVTQSQQKMADGQTALAVSQSSLAYQQRTHDEAHQKSRQLIEAKQALIAKDYAQPLAQAQLAHDELAAQSMQNQHQIAQLQQQTQLQQATLTEQQQQYQASQQQQASKQARFDLITELLSKHQSNDSEQALWQVIDVKPGWQQAADSLLMHLLDVAVVDDENHAQGFRLTPEAAYQCDTLTAPVNLAPWLSNVHWVEDKLAAENLLTHLDKQAICVTKAGELIAHGLSVLPSKGAESLLALSHEQQKLKQLLEQLSAQNFERQACVSRSTQALAKLQVNLSEQQQLARELQQQISLHATQIAKLTQQQQDQQHRIDDYSQQQVMAEEVINKSTALIEQLTLQIEQQELQQQQFSMGHEQSLQAKQDNLLQHRALKQAKQSYLQKKQTIVDQKQTLTTNKLLAEQNSQQQRQKKQQLVTEKQQTSQALHSRQDTQDRVQSEQLQQALQSSLQQQQLLQQQLADNRQQQSELQQQLDSSLIMQKQQLEQHQGLTQSLSALKLRREGIKGQIDAQVQLLAEQQVKITQVAESLPDNAKITTWSKSLAQLKQAIDDLGAINLAAIEEYETQYQRKAYLDEQDADLNQALVALESAIKKIDRETRVRFKTTFDAVNEDLQALFPKVFGGGRAYLALTDDDLLDTGVTIMAQPPGKKNSTIHLLSGGEKALTALSLVFAIFRLNPAPFCMLDEVDAPLDDANVGRFCRLLEEMSQSVQFIYISHNKITMEMAEQLIGVTMHEPGVSRVVAVDIDAAVAMADVV
ncbi:AAA family ATPase [Shewanella maritima]|uniref:AAA family ATPase n=1 Tax=Shewanella maritima TaxID=2520507 RepID=UPI00373571D5